MKDQDKRFEFIPFLINVLIPLIFGALASLFRSQMASLWYITLNKPGEYPSFTASGLVRSVIAIIIGFSAFLIWRRRRQITHYTRVIICYLSHLTLNLFWAFIFFELHWLGASMVVAGLLMLLGIYNTLVFFRISKTAGILFLTYLIWSSSIAYLSVGVYFLN